MAARQKRRARDAAFDIKEAVRCTLGNYKISPEQYALPRDGAKQLTLMGDCYAYGNVLHAVSCGADETRSYTVLCGECDRFVAITGAVSELIRNGAGKIVIAADTLAERDNLMRALELARASLEGAEIITYLPGAYDAQSVRKISSDILSFAMSRTAQIFIIGRDSFCRHTNLVFQPQPMLDGEPFVDIISSASPVVITSSRKIAAGRSLMKNAAVFHPCLAFMFAGEILHIRGSVIYSPARAYNEKEDVPSSVQLEF